MEYEDTPEWYKEYLYKKEHKFDWIKNFCMCILKIVFNPAIFIIIVVTSLIAHGVISAERESDAEDLKYANVEPAVFPFRDQVSDYLSGRDNDFMSITFFARNRATAEEFKRRVCGKDYSNYRYSYPCTITKLDDGTCKVKFAGALYPDYTIGDLERNRVCRDDSRYSISERNRRLKKLCRHYVRSGACPQEWIDAKKMKFECE